LSPGPPVRYFNWFRSKDLATVVELEVPGRMEVVDDLEATVVQIGARGGLDPDTAHFLGVAMREALTNAIRHGNGCAPDRPVQVRIALDDGCLTLTVRDWGPGFEAAALPDPDAPENRCLGCGRGIFFMRRFADEVVFHHPEGGGQAVELRKRLPASRPS
jgi:serine/threonine-protein kinase RsbW